MNQEDRIILAHSAIKQGLWRAMVLSKYMPIIKENDEQKISVSSTSDKSSESLDTDSNIDMTICI
ncbi:MAG: hypothetical protein Terrestrivirus1_277 [Terrestrivirus sp.]|uniref:Uncharacterized protein n=1 Tax=Terrestrivirus sp. TaxID=2487775 RepID=A0A3G4ZP79_9VIRU|nr:MAG: hypothetical protein Terrestrivirus1_277 [Terrestrivirus sp.]